MRKWIVGAAGWLKNKLNEFLTKESTSSVGKISSNLFEVELFLPQNWIPPFIEEINSKGDEVRTLKFFLRRHPERKDENFYVCSGCLEAGGEIDDIYATSSLPQKSWPLGKGVPRELAKEMFTHAREHELMWRWVKTL